MKIKTTFLIILFPILCLAQKESSNWFFGHQAGLNFNTNPPTPMSGELSTLEGCTSISTPEGELLFYSDGTNVWNKNHESMFPDDTPADEYLHGYPSSTSSGLVVPYINNDDLYYIFTVDSHDAWYLQNSVGLKYSTIDMSLNGGLGGIVEGQKNIPLLPITSEKITATKTADGNGYWLITHYIDSFYAYKITADGVNTTPVISTLTPTIQAITGAHEGVAVTNMRGYIKSNLQSNKIAAAFYSDNKQEAYEDYTLPHPKWVEAVITKGTLYLYDFDNETGIVSNPVSLMEETDLGSPYGVEFSPLGNYLYAQIDYYKVEEVGIGHATINGVINQYDLAASDILNSKIEIYEEVYETSEDTNLMRGSLQIAIDGKIYHTTIGENHLSYIEFPNLQGTNANYIENGIFLGDEVFTRWGLPVFIQTLFEPDIFAINLCEGDATYFYIDNSEVTNIVWNFGDPDSGVANTSTEPDPTHIYTSTGTYDVVVEFHINSLPYSVTKQITIVENPIIPELPDLYICENEGGNGVFDFTEISTLISNANDEEITITYYEEIGGTPIENPTNFVTSENQTIYVSIKNENGCTDESQFNLIIHPSDFAPELLSIETCDLGNGFGVFDIQSNYDFLVNYFSFPVEIYFYNSSIDFENNTNPIQISETYENITPYFETIFVKITNLETTCVDSTSFELSFLEAFELPNIANVSICESSYQIADFDFQVQENFILENLSFENSEILFFISEQNLNNNQNPINTEEIFQNTTNPQTIYIKVINSDTNCIETTSFEIFAEECEVPEITIPNVLDATNEESFEIEDLINYYPYFKMYIYNRYGTMVYEGDKNTKSWDGTSKHSDKPLPAGTYYYVLELNRNGFEPKTGWIYLNK
ncbi:T9SS type B sorting domain-containing protein [Aureivirga marina]|uniref:T9SS type B sorting domain-containing protein n=1 Tax=Aureivirga marina TaxID=1182451 RepID=UPI0018C9C0F9|nr:gliding motility-associated C-terminal domain-containing protein [Aureivirga marina]